ncbi:TPA: restriction endonuclease subunit S [Vibrio vulnificus]|nr:restriction endonuclease subunit S [Vibrio vulnificus]HDY8168469.1 restriction endonuclease subunit S [Vibrio vulnificus]
MKFKSYSFKELLSNIVDNRGKTCPVGDTGLPLIATNCIKEHSLYPVFEKVRYVSDETYNNWFRGHPQPGDMIFVCKGSPGRVNWVPDPVNFCIAQDMVAIRADTTKVYPKYLFALLRSQTSQQKILNMHVGSLIPHFKKGDFGNLYFELPEDLEYQKKVGDAYFDFCLKIESNTQTNQTLEQMAQAIFKSWFVDFDPVKAKMNGEQPEGMDEATASLFPEKLVESELGLIPEGWEITDIDNATSKVFSGGTPSTKNESFWGGELPWFSSGETRNNFIIETEKHITQEGVDGSSTKAATYGDVLIASAGQGYTRGQTSFNSINCYINQSVVALRASDCVSPYWLYYCLERRYDEMRSVSDSHSSRGSLTTKLLKALPIAKPSKDIVNAFDAIVESLVRKQIANAKQNKELSLLRDTLLPKLLSGGITLD